eukprot:Lithocolla_globosa_v1_NODE_38_length_8412_cov_18.562642.p4 type:complete len:104 gc:universal NODE_38_length_8412_cov_18.562642:2969-3280(+)
MAYAFHVSIPHANSVALSTNAIDVNLDSSSGTKLVWDVPIIVRYVLPVSVLCAIKVILCRMGFVFLANLIVRYAIWMNVLVVIKVFFLIRENAYLVLSTVSCV